MQKGKDRKKLMMVLKEIIFGSCLVFMLGFCVPGVGLCLSMSLSLASDKSVRFMAN